MAEDYRATLTCRPVMIVIISFFKIIFLSCTCTQRQLPLKANGWHKRGTLISAKVCEVILQAPRPTILMLRTDVHVPMLAAAVYVCSTV